jgi:pilus assembly protein CpaF
VFVLRFGHPDWAAMQTRQAGLEGTGAIRLLRSLRMSVERVRDTDWSLNLRASGHRRLEK